MHVARLCGHIVSVMLANVCGTSQCVCHVAQRICRDVMCVCHVAVACCSAPVHEAPTRATTGGISYVCVCVCVCVITFFLLTSFCLECCVISLFSIRSFLHICGDLILVPLCVFLVLSACVDVVFRAGQAHRQPARHHSLFPLRPIGSAGGVRGGCARRGE